MNQHIVEKYEVDNTAEDTNENAASVSSFESVSSTSLPVTANIEDKLEDLAKDDIIEDVVNFSTPDSTLSTEFVTKESNPEDVRVDLSNSILLEQDNEIMRSTVMIIQVNSFLYQYFMTANNFAMKSDQDDDNY